MRLTVSIGGIDTLMARLRALGGVASGRVIAQAAEAGGRIVEAHARILAPVDLGTLRASISSYRGRIEPTRADVHVGPTVHYGPYIEFGTGIYAEGGKGRKTPWKYYNQRWQRWVRTRGSRPHPYLRPALYRNKNAVIAAVQATVRRLLDEAVRR